MNTSLIFTALMILASASISQASTQKACAFGESSWELKEAMETETGTPGKIWYQGEYISLHVPERLNGLTKVEKEMVLLVMGHDENVVSEKEALEDFSSADGYIQYFHHNSNGKNYAIVASYPGDNEFGFVIEVKTKYRSGGAPIAIGDFAAVISDGDFEDCVVTE